MREKEVLVKHKHLQKQSNEINQWIKATNSDT